MEHDSKSLEIPDESYFASFTDMLVGIIFVFIILLMIVANNLQEATNTVLKHDKALEVARNMDLRKAEQTLFFESRERILREIERSMVQAGVPVTVDERQGTIRFPEGILFGNDENKVNDRGQQVLIALAGVLGTYLPCISPTNNPAKLAGCEGLDLPTTDGLDAVFIEDHPDARVSTEQKWLLATERTLSVFKSLTYYESYLDKELKNIAGAPILNVNAHQDRRPGQKDRNNPALNKSIELRFVMRNPTPEDLRKLKEAQDAEALKNSIATPINAEPAANPPAIAAPR